jgi:hypothetical protein
MRLMTARARSVALTAHVVSSVGWLGATIAFLTLAVTGVASSDRATVRAVYVAAEPLTWFAIVPLAVASFVTGLLQSVTSPWGLFRHYWVIAKLGLTVFATVVLMLYTGTVSDLAGEAANPESSIAQLRELGWSPLLHAAVAVVVLLTTTTLAVVKPRGMTKYGRRRQRTPRADANA